MSGWIAVASAEHVALGRHGGFMQVCHGKSAPLRRIRGGDTVIYYSPVERMGEKRACQRFTAIGTIRPCEPYQVDMDNGFKPFRRDVDWRQARDAPIRDLLDRLSFTAGRANWGYAFRFGILPIEEADICLIAAAMGAAPD